MDRTSTIVLTALTLGVAAAGCRSPHRTVPALGSVVDWRNTGPGGGGWIQSICASPHDADELFVGCDVGGFYHSADGGDGYTILNTGLRDYFVECIAPHPTDPSLLYLGCEGGVYKSTDRGRSWNWLRSGFPAVARYRFSAPIGALAIDPNAPHTLYAGVGRPRRRDYGAGTVYKTVDGGDTWAVVNRPGSLPDQAVVSDLVVDPADSRHVLLACSAGVYQSRDGGVDWELTVAGLPHRHARRLAVCRTKPNVVYLTIESTPGSEPWQGGVYKSVDGGRSWQACNTGLKQSVGRPGQAAPLTSNYDRIVVHPTDPDIAYVGGTGWVNASLWKTVDGGETWTDVVLRQGEGTNIDTGWIGMWGPTVKCLAMSPADPDMLYFGTSGMVYKTTDAGKTWQQKYAQVLPDGRVRGTGLEVTCLHSITVDPGNPRRIFFGFYDIGLLISEDGGKTFRRSMSTVPRAMQNSCFTVVVDPDEPERLWAAFGTWGSNTGTVAESADNGRTWQFRGADASGLPNARNRVLILDASSPASTRRLFVTSQGHGIYASDDGGQHWEPRNSGLPHGNIAGFVRHPQQSQTFWCALAAEGKEPGAIYRSDDTCRSWTKVSRDLAVADVKRLVISTGGSPRLYLAVRDRKLGAEFYPGGLYRSDDGGVTWQLILRDDFVAGLAVDPRDPDVVYAGLTDHPYHDESAGDGVVMTRDGGRSWTSLNTERLTCRQVNCIALDPADPDRLYLGTGGNAAFIGRVPRQRRQRPPEPPQAERQVEPDCL